ncbi:MAG: ATP-grasp domain-containing protein, partial [Pseudomonadota bacterium]|nr:ATP-grasp domain-containing protein [Pseudomonadota bacterium]
MAISPRPIKRLLISNRGEIAVRIIRSAREMGISTVAIYSDIDATCAHRYHADFAIRLTGNTITDTYLNGDQIISLAVASNCDAIHPGYGFLSENSNFAAAVVEAGLIYVGPTANAMRKLGNKLAAKRLLAKHGIPVVAGSLQPLTSHRAINTANYPILLKAALGGGGKGMRVVNSAAALPDAFASCQRQAKNYFADDTMLWEQFIPDPYHVEVQILADHYGNTVHLYERDCTIQRRFQKLLEEAPSPHLNAKTRDAICACAVKIAEIVGYTCAGTVEFICPDAENFYFMEVNTRIQVEHPVSEMITGFDLIKEQLRIASGEKLSCPQQAAIKSSGHAIELRINCEDPQANFAPSPARIKSLQLPYGAFTRVDSHIYQGYQVPAAYDSLLAKLICWGQTRTEAIARLLRALAELRIGGVKTTAPFFYYLLHQQDFR